jgi:2-keto-4-pentenoate hydratase/2-oxohepta-3-ene-1,7-dioic acid hydratase in catechol pathway
MKLARYIADGAVRAGRVDGDRVTDLLVEDGSGGEPVLRCLAGEATAAATTRALDDVGLLSPLGRPEKILCIGLNYLDHCRETGAEPPPKPILFAKFPNALTGHLAPIQIDPATSTQVDFEAELAAVIGRRCRNIDEASALGVVAGYSIANDVSARDAQFADGQWVRGKSFDTFCPLGPWLVTADEVGDPQALGIRCWVNDTLLQDSSTSEMIFGVASLISYLSRVMTLEPGDVLLTGTPWGVGFARRPPIFLGAGDVVRIAVDRLGELVNPVVASADSA